jgi:hypothetical protein
MEDGLRQRNRFHADVLQRFDDDRAGRRRTRWSSSRRQFLFRTRFVRDINQSLHLRGSGERNQIDLPGRHTSDCVGEGAGCLLWMVPAARDG